MNAWHLAARLLAGLLLTLTAYGAGIALQRRLGGHALANPVLLAVAIVIIVLRVTGLSCDEYLAGADLVSAALGPATVALAVPLYTHAGQMRASGARLVVAAGLARISQTG
jgi:putative effector of murein hydrolase